MSSRTWQAANDCFSQDCLRHRWEAARGRVDLHAANPLPATRSLPPRQEERFEVLSGEVRAVVDGEERALSRG